MQIQAVGAAQRIGLVENAIDDHRQRERQRGEEDAAIAGKQRRNDQRRGSAPATAPSATSSSRIADPETAHRHPGGIGAGAIEGALAERDQATAHQRDDARAPPVPWRRPRWRRAQASSAPRSRREPAPRMRSPRPRACRRCLPSDFPRRCALEEALGPKCQHQRHDQIDDEKLRPRHEMDGRGAGETDKKRRDGRALHAARDRR